MEELDTRDDVVVEIQRMTPGLTSSGATIAAGRGSRLALMGRVVVVGAMIGCAASASPPPATTASAATAPATVSAPRSDPDWLVEMLPRRIVYAVPGMAERSATKDVVYKQAGASALTMDVWSPAQAGPRPAIVFVHGGPIPGDLRTQPKDWGVYVSYGQLAAASGFVGITFNHRLHGLDRIADAQADVVDLVGYLRANAARHGIDRDRVCLWAFSGGGTLLSAAFGDQLAGVRCLVSFYGLLDRRPERADIPASISDEALQQLSPVHHVAAGHRVPPMLIARAGKDAPQINATVDAFVREAKTRNAPVQVIEHPTGRHGFDTLDNDDRSRAVIAEAIQFITTQLDAR
jgi:acetyl esterase/lipase